MHAAKFPVWCLDVLQATSLIIHYILLLNLDSIPGIAQQFQSRVLDHE